MSAPERLYHYTTGSGLKGIVEGRSIWASDYRFLNDSQEFRHGLSVLHHVINEKRAALSEIHGGALFRILRDVVDRITDPDSVVIDALQVFVASFSMAPDLLSQWRGYNGGKGYSVGINYDWLVASVNGSGFGLSNVMYHENEQRSAVEARIEQLIALSAADQIDNIGENLKLWLQIVFQTLAYCKHTSFAEEQEYRAVRITSGWPTGVQTRDSAFGIIPYFSIPLSHERAHNPLNHENNLGFEHIIVGPALHDRQIRAVDAMLAPMKMRFSVTKSAIPFVAD